MSPGTIHSDSTLKTSWRSPSTLATWYCGSSTLMETFNLNSLYIAVFILCVFISTVLFICCKLIRQDSRIDALYQPQVIRPVALERPHRPMAKLRKPKNRNFTSKGSQTANVNSVHAAFQKSSISNQNPLSENSTISNIEDEIKIESVQLFTASPDFYEDPSAAYESVCDISRPSVIYSCVHHWFLWRHCRWILKATNLKYVRRVSGLRENQESVLWLKIFWAKDSPTHHFSWCSYWWVCFTRKIRQPVNWFLLVLVPVWSVISCSLGNDLLRILTQNNQSYQADKT